MTKKVFLVIIFVSLFFAISSVVMYGIINLPKTQQNTPVNTTSVETPVNVTRLPINGSSDLVLVTDTYERLTISSVLPNGWEIINNSNNLTGDIRFSKNNHHISFPIFRSGGGSCEYPGDKNYGKNLGKLDIFRFKMDKFIEIKNFTGVNIRIDSVGREDSTQDGFTVRYVCQSDITNNQQFVVMPYVVVLPTNYNNSIMKEITDILRNIVVL